MQALRAYQRLVRVRPPVARMCPELLAVIPQPLTLQANISNSTKPKAPKLKLPKPFIPQGTVLPFTFKFQDESFRIENITLARAEEAWVMLNLAMEMGEGYSRDELKPLEEFRINIQNMNNYFMVIHEKDDNIASVINLISSPLCRSEHAVHYAGPIVINTKYRNKNYARDLISKLYFELGRTILGFKGMISARTVVGKSINAIVRAGQVFNGIIPNCSLLEGTGRIMDLSFTNVDPRHITRALVNAPAPELAPLLVTDDIPEHVQSTKRLLETFPGLSLNGEHLSVSNASPTDVWAVERIIRQAALDADGFAIDEFTKDGRFNRKHLYHSHVIVMKSASGEIMAAAVFGPTKLCRSYNAEQVGGYLIVLPEFRRMGYGSAFLNHLIGLSEEMDVTAILTDAFSDNVVAQQFLDKMDFMVIGTAPHSGYVLGKGYRHSYQYWRST